MLSTLYCTYLIKFKVGGSIFTLPLSIRGTGRRVACPRSRSQRVWSQDASPVHCRASAPLALPSLHERALLTSVLGGLPFAHPPQISVAPLPLQIPTVFLMTFLDALETGYGKYKNPYHNQIHAADVTQTVHCFLLRTGMVVGTLEVTLLGFRVLWLQTRRVQPTVDTLISFFSPRVLFFGIPKSLQSWIGLIHSREFLGGP